MATELGTAYVQIVPSARGISGSIGNVLKGESASAGRSAGLSIAGAIKGALVTAGIGEALKKTILEGAELQQNLGGSEAVFGKWAETIQGYAEDAYKNMGLSASEYLATANKMGSLFQGSGIEQAKALDMTAQAMQRAADVASVMGIDATMAMESIAGAAKGNFTMMDNLGVAMNATTLSAYALEKGLNFDWNTASNAEKAELAMQMFMERTSQYANNYYKESVDTISGSFEAFRAAAQNLLGGVALGQDVVPLLKNLVTTAKNFLVGNLIPTIGNILQAIPQVISSFMKGNFIGRLMKDLNQLSGQILQGSTAFIDAGLGLIMKLAEGIAKGLPAIIRNLPVIVGNIADIINNNAPKVIATGVNIIKTLSIGIIKAIPVLIQNIPQILTALWKAFSAFNWANLGRSIVVGLKTSMMGPVQQGMQGVIQTIKMKTGAIINAFKAPFIKAKSAVQSIANSIKNLFNFKFNLPKLKVPKFSISPPGWKVGDLVKGKIPHLSVKWNAQGGIYDSASIIGYGVGEAGREAILPLDRNTGWMDELAGRISGGGVLNVMINLDGQTIGQSTVNYINGQTLMFGTSPVMI